MSKTEVYKRISQADKDTEDPKIIKAYQDITDLIDRWVTEDDMPYPYAVGALLSGLMWIFVGTDNSEGGYNYMLNKMHEFRCAYMQLEDEEIGPPQGRA